MNKKSIYKKWWIGISGMIVLFVLIVSFSNSSKTSQTINNTETSNAENIATQQTISNSPTPNQKLFDVVKVVDGDTIDVSVNGTIERMRLIGINTPETVDPRKPVECFGVEASSKAKSLLGGKKVVLESDSSQGEKDKYGRLLRYVFLEDGTNFNLTMIKEGYAYEYTCNTPYKYQLEFKKAQKEAETNKAGLWGDTCNGKTTQSVITNPTSTTQTNQGSGSCTIKGNINSKGEKIYHSIGCGSYKNTVINESQGEQWFCSDEEAVNAGWRKALNCN
jgi:micrococcal nuclease